MSEVIPTSEIVKRIAGSTRDSQATVKGVLDHFFEEVQDAVEAGDSVRTPMGTFEHRVHAPRTARNPQTGEPVEVPERNGVGFKASDTFKRRLNG